MSREYEIDPRRIEDGNDILPHPRHSSPTIGQVIGIMMPLRKGGMMPEYDRPWLAVSCEILTQPRHHRGSNLFLSKL
jgi:hypothetical protein